MICRKKKGCSVWDTSRESNVVGRSRKRVRGEGRSRENREGRAGAGGAEGSHRLSPSQGTTATLNATPN